MECTENVKSRCDTSSTVPAVAQLILQMSLPVLKQEIVDIVYEETSQCRDTVVPSDPSSSEYVNYYDSKDFALKEINLELAKEEFCLPDESVNSKVVTEVSLELGNSSEIKREDQSRLLLGINENEDRVQPCKIETELLEEQGTLSSDGDSSRLHDSLVTPGGLQCNLCNRTFKDGLSLLKHSSEHIKVEEIATHYLHECRYCDLHFDSRDRLFGHVNDFHNADNAKRNDIYVTDDLKCKYCSVEFTDKYKLNNHVRLCRTGNKLQGTGYKCEFCEGIYKTERTLTLHIRRSHHDYGQMFECWCGKQYRSPIHLKVHEYKTHSDRRKNNKKTKEHKCEFCEAAFYVKQHLTHHTRRMHHDFGSRSFECWCGKRFRTPIHLLEHKKRHGLSVRDKTEEKLQCDLCQKFFKTKQCLIVHLKKTLCKYIRKIKTSNNDLLKRNNEVKKDTLGNIGTDNFDDLVHSKPVDKNVRLKCELCGQEFKIIENVQHHLRQEHVDQIPLIRKNVKCKRCDADFENAYRLTKHRKLCYAANNGEEDVKRRYICHSCGGEFKSKQSLTCHIKSMHYAYGKSFDCWCGKQFRTPKNLADHRLLHRNKTECSEFKCKDCEVVFPVKSHLTKHLKRYHSKETSECWCGKQFRSPIHLSDHKRRSHRKIAKSANGEFHCDYCQKVYGLRSNLVRHIKRCHYDFGRMFECCCGKQFRSTLDLSEHERQVHRNFEID